MTELIETTRLIFAMLSVLIGTEYHEGGGAYYHRASLRDVAILRNQEGWLPEGAVLDPDWPCLAAWPKHDASIIGRNVLAYLPNCSYHI